MPEQMSAKDQAAERARAAYERKSTSDGLGAPSSAPARGGTTPGRSHVVVVILKLLFITPFVFIGGIFTGLQRDLNRDGLFSWALFPFLHAGMFFGEELTAYAQNRAADHSRIAASASKYR